MKRINVVKKIKVWILVIALTCSSTLMYGCKGAREEENSNVVVQKDTIKIDDEKKTTGEKKTTEGESTVEKDKTTDSAESTGEESGETKKDEQQSSEEATTPMDGQSGTQEDSSETGDSDTTTTTPTQAPTVEPTTAPTIAPTTAPTQAPTQAPTTAPTTAKPNYGAVINHLSYDMNTYSRRRFDETGIVTTAENVISGILTTSMSEVERVRAIHDYLVKNVVYDEATANKVTIGTVNGSEPAFEAYGALVNGLAVCEGYSEAFVLLCWVAGIEARIVEGTGNGGGHEWNIVKIEGQWYQIDVTWGDPKYNGVHPPKGSTENLQYDYFLITTADMLNKRHTIENFYNSETISCTSTAYYEYAKQCTFDVKLGSIPYVIISNYAQADSAVTSYNNQGIKQFAFIYVENSLDYNTLMSNACNLTVQNMGVGVSCEISIQGSMGYNIVIVTLKY